MHCAVGVMTDAAHKQHQWVGPSLSPRRLSSLCQPAPRWRPHRAGWTANEIQVLRALDSLGSGKAMERQAPQDFSLPSEPSVQFGPAQVSSGRRRGWVEGEGEQASGVRQELLRWLALVSLWHACLQICVLIRYVCASVCVQRRLCQWVRLGTSECPIIVQPSVFVCVGSVVMVVCLYQCACSYVCVCVWCCMCSHITLELMSPFLGWGGGVGTSQSPAQALLPTPLPRLVPTPTARCAVRSHPAAPGPEPTSSSF